MLLNAEIKYIEKFDLNPFISIVLWRPICYVCVIQYKFHQYRFNCQLIIIWDFSSSWGISALNFAAQLCTAKMLDEEWSLNGSSRTVGNAQWSSPATPTAHSRCQNISERLSSVFLNFWLLLSLLFEVQLKQFCYVWTEETTAFLQSRQAPGSCLMFCFGINSLILLFTFLIPFCFKAISQTTGFLRTDKDFLALLTVVVLYCSSSAYQHKFACLH